MPLDGHSYLVSQGWSGRGTGLRQGAITRPITISQKKSLAGLGKDRDEAFPFWDQSVLIFSYTSVVLIASCISLFSVASKSIQVKISNDSEHTSDSDEKSTSDTTIKRTTTGLLCNRRPNDCQTPATSGSSTPTQMNIPKSKSSLIALAKREAAKRNLYSRFYCGPVLHPKSEAPSPSPRTGESLSADHSQSRTKGNNKAPEKEREKGKSSRKKKRKADEENNEIEKRERKRRKKELKQLEKLEKKVKKASSVLLASEDTPDCVGKIERRKRKEERLQRKLELKPLVTPEGVPKSSEESVDVKSRAEKDADTILDSVQENDFPRAKKKRRTDG
ncbi:hypothetical protein E1B28_012329 [Marasmius oreades]|uniref:G-patch domain-containing protein n=1 Tax=Marasmius oreades TaxID=181124 RepID=A0A9P7RRE6_9AGAR|nr:uncharacterized protein E1B28_012329 [Marasmius oreades]KAG7088320.1 hypothetical protein E1B28_012329 [Marasmius oreades]